MQARVPGGTALAVDRDVFSSAVHERVTSHPRITVVREEVRRCRAPGIVATGPAHVRRAGRGDSRALGVESLAFYDAIAPIVAHESIDESVVFRASRYGKETMDAGDAEGGAYLNCPFTREQYEAFIDALIAADQHHGHEFDEVPYFEGCMPVEEMARRGRETLRFGPMKPVGLRDPRTGREAYAVVQLRMEDRARPDVEHRRLPDAASHPGAAARVPDDPRPRERGVPALRIDPPKLVRQFAGVARRRTCRCATIR